ncbi:MAG: FtsX-like permease family protein, partial [Sphingobacteriaceae bacterium]
KTMGSSRGQLILQFLSETLLITVMAVCIAVFLCPVILKIFKDFIPDGVKADYLHRPKLILFLIGLTGVVTVLSGFYPALVLSGYRPVLVLKSQATGHSSKSRNAFLRKTLTVIQFVIAQFFIMATLLVGKQIYYALHKDLGYKKDAIIILHLPSKRTDLGRDQVFINRLHSLPQVELISIGGAAPASGGTSSTEYVYNDGKKEIKTDVQLKYGDENYISLYKIKLLSGRNLTGRDTSKAILINATYARELGFKNPTEASGNYITYNEKQLQIIGVVADFYQKSLRSAVKPLAILTSPDNYNAGTIHIALKPQTAGGNEWKTAIAAIQKSWKEIYPEDDFDYAFFDENIAKLYQSEQHTSTLLSWTTSVSILISCLGLLGLALYTTNQRTKEIGVRKVLGASVTQILSLLSRELILLVLLAFVLVTPLAWWAMNKWMQDFADRTPISWWIFLVSGGGMLLLALCTSSFQTIKAALANPVKSLRSE